MPRTGPPPGAWTSPISAAEAVAAGRALDAVAFAGDEIWWSEGRPAEGGRVVVCRTGSDGAVHDLLPAGWNARTRVHEYGGTAWVPVPTAAGWQLVFCSLADQRLYRCAPGFEPTPLTPQPTRPAGLRFADLTVDGHRDRLLAVRETHDGDGTFGTVRRTLVAIALAAGSETAGDDVLPAAERADFIAAPRISPHGDRLAWISWNHPEMPWDSTTVHLADLDAAGQLRDIRAVAGGPGISVVDVGFTPDGSLLLMTDESGWWQPVLVDPASGERRRPTGLAADFAPPLWQLGRRSWAALPGGRLLVRPDGKPAVLDTLDGSLKVLDDSWTWVGDLATNPAGRMALVVGGDRASTTVVVVEPDGRRQELRRAADTALPPEFLPDPVARQVDGVHVVVYPPSHPDQQAAPGTAPLLVTVHGGPTAQHPRHVSAQIAYFTSRGFAVAAVDYRGSTGYGRAYRDALRGNWSAADVEDVTTVARALLADGTAGAAVISGGSAGGLTVFGALLAADSPFAAGTSSYGVADITALVADTHDFESRYLDSLIGTDPAVLVERSPLSRAGDLRTPVLLLQGGLDPIVPLAQAEMFAAACRRAGVAHALLVFPDESHGFRRAENKIAALEAEMSFYGQVLGFEPEGVPRLALLG